MEHVCINNERSQKPYTCISCTVNFTGGEFPINKILEIKKTRSVELFCILYFSGYDSWTLKMFTCSTSLLSLRIEFPISCLCEIYSYQRLHVEELPAVSFFQLKWFLTVNQ